MPHKCGINSGVAKGMAGCMLRDAGLSDGGFDRLLHDRFIHIMGDPLPVSSLCSDTSLGTPHARSTLPVTVARCLLRFLALVPCSPSSLVASRHLLMRHPMIPLARCSQWVVPVLSIVARTRSSTHSWIACVVGNDHGPRGPSGVEIGRKRSGRRWENRKPRVGLYAAPPPVSRPGLRLVSAGHTGQSRRAIHEDSWRFGCHTDRQAMDIAFHEICVAIAQFSW